MPSAEHDYEVTDRYGGARRSVCTRCGIIEWYAWMPGWPGFNEYYDDTGFLKLASEPPCIARRQCA